MTAAHPSPIPVPSNFPVRWTQPDDERMFWFQDNLHFPVAVPPSNATIFQAAFAIGTTRAQAKQSVAIVDI